MVLISVWFPKSLQCDIQRPMLEPRSLSLIFAPKVDGMLFSIRSVQARLKRKPRTSTRAHPWALFDIFQFPEAPARNPGLPLSHSPCTFQDCEHLEPSGRRTESSNACSLHSVQVLSLHSVSSLVGTCLSHLRPQPPGFYTRIAC